MRNARLRHKSSVQTAIGKRHRRIEQKAQGAMGGSFNTREFFHGRAPQIVKAVRYFFFNRFMYPDLSGSDIVRGVNFKHELHQCFTTARKSNFE